MIDPTLHEWVRVRAGTLEEYTRLTPDASIRNWAQHSRMPPVRTPVTLVPHGGNPSRPCNDPPRLRTQGLPETADGQVMERKRQVWAARVHSLEQVLHTQRQVRMPRTRSNGAGAAQEKAGVGGTYPLTGAGAAYATAGEDATYSINGAGAA